MTAEDPVALATLVEQYRRWSTSYLEQQLSAFVAAEAYNRKRREAIDTVLAERYAAEGADAARKGSGS